MELLCACRETLSSVCRLQPGESSNCSREGRALKCSFCGWWHSWPEPCLSRGCCTSIAGEFGNSLFFRFQVKDRFPSPLCLYNPKNETEGVFYVGAQGPGSCQPARGWYCIIHALCLSDGKSDHAGDHGVPCQLSQTCSVTVHLPVQRLWGGWSKTLSHAEEKQEGVETWI